MTEDFQRNLISRRSFLFTMVAISCLGLPLETQAAASFEPFSFAFVNDTHLTTGKPDSYLLLQESQLFLQDCVKSLNAEKLDFVIFGGDQVETPGPDDKNWQLFLDVVQNLSCPWSFVLGEKSVSGPGSVDKMKTYGSDWKGKGIQTDRPYWSQTPLPGVHIIGLDTSRPNSTTGDISNEQLDWLKQDLAANQGKFTIVFSHHPLLAPPPFDSGPPWDDYIAPQGASAREILGGSKDVHLAISGHLHINKIQQERDIWYVSNASLDVYPCAYRIFKVTPQGISVQSYQITMPALIKKARQQLDGSNLAFKYNEAKPQLFAELAQGTRLDWAAALPLVAGRSAEPLGEKKKKLKEKNEKPAREEKKPKEKHVKEKKEPEEKPEKPSKKHAKKDDKPDTTEPANTEPVPLESQPPVEKPDTKIPDEKPPVEMPDTKTPDEKPPIEKPDTKMPDEKPSEPDKGMTPVKKDDATNKKN